MTNENNTKSIKRRIEPQDVLLCDECNIQLIDAGSHWTCPDCGLQHEFVMYGEVDAKDAKAAGTLGSSLKKTARNLGLDIE